MESYEQVIERVKEYCKEQVNATSYLLFFSKIEGYDLNLEENMAYISVPNDFSLDVLTKRYSDLLNDAFLAVLGFDIEVSIVMILPTEPGEEGGAPGSYALTFDNFIKGDSNSLALAAAISVSQKPAANRNNPLFIYGDSGLGKTHLLTAICIETKSNYPDFNIIMVDGESFTNEFIEAIQSGDSATFHGKYRAADILLVDDIQFLSGKESTQEEFFHTFNTLLRLGKQIVLVSDRPPREIRSLHDRLQTRFLSGLIVDIQPPKYETRVAIIKRKAELLELDLPEEVIEFIANNLKNNIRQLEGSVKKLNAYKKLENIEPTLLSAQSAIKDILNEIQPVPVTIEKVLSEITRTMNVTTQELRSTSRKSNISKARKLAMYILQQVTPLTTTDIGREFSNRDHSTVVYSIQAAEKNLNSDKSLRALADDIIKNVKSL